ncbi:hypothetical protein [Sediminibacterium soli]|uniref:hypothetical protein n=1 Tax=Sediminibacterium soli TaxID=2698829 RepID=UPI00192A2092|nr:hypothetical protein [Sediminibacterium soli]NCI47209.1 hypothetical protein [Sediminibacterium soli]
MAKKQLRKDLEEKITGAIGDLASKADRKVQKAVRKAAKWLADVLHKPKPAKPKTTPAKKKAAVKKTAVKKSVAVKTAKKSAPAR